ncbi:hypothetical protein NSS76_02265 [Bacillus sp. FSL R5-0654]|uniref:hypothetical protein n=1 Tax=Bacillus TaxID=1386 RepID=UPI00094048B3|nr:MULTISPECIES: hypothetical protein [Bacillus]WNF51265.1 hypothetical protein RHP70_02235 [Bacillus sp. SG20001]
MNDKQYIDCLSRAGTLALGHIVVREAIQNDLQSYMNLHTLDITIPIKEAFVDELFASLPKSFSKKAKVHF